MKSTTSLRRNNEFRRLYSNGKSAASKCVVVYCRRNYTGKIGEVANRLGITVSTKIGGAVVRNRVRRRLKEIYRLNEHTLSLGYDIVIVARTHAREASWSELHSSVIYLFKKLGLTF